jgi:hypothetical protein
MPSGKKRHDYTKESDLCELLTAEARSEGWKVFPETDFDLLLVASHDVRTRGASPGDQIGVEAKLAANVDVLGQAMPAKWGSKGPNFHAVLVPLPDPVFIEIARRLGIMVVTASAHVWKWDPESKRTVERWERVIRGFRELPATLRHYYDEPIWYPDIEIDTPAGVKSPKKITEWKVKAVRLCMQGLERGYLLTHDFHVAGISMTVWNREGWIEPIGKIGRSKKYKLVDSAKPPHILYPEIVAAITKDMNK